LTTSRMTVPLSDRTMFFKNFPENSHEVSLLAQFSIRLYQWLMMIPSQASRPLNLAPQPIWCVVWRGEETRASQGFSTGAYADCCRVRTRNWREAESGDMFSKRAAAAELLAIMIWAGTQLDVCTPTRFERPLALGCTWSGMYAR
jgi:hypothetical protein